MRSVKEECLSKLILFGEASLRRALSEYIDHYPAERNHQGKGNRLLFPSPGALNPQVAGASAAVNASAVSSDITAERLDSLTIRDRLLP